MNTTSRSTQSRSKRLKIGAAVLAGAEAVDTTLVAARLGAFTDQHRGYLETERTVDAAEARLETERLKLAQLGAAHDEAVEKLACSLANDGQPRTNPFEDFGVESPSHIKRMPPAEAARAVRTLLATLGRTPNLSAATREAGERVDQMTQLVEAALPPYQTALDELRAARRISDVVGRKYDDTVSALRRAARAAADDGADDLYPALFPNQPRAAKKAKTAPAQADERPQTQPSPTA